MKSVSDVAPTGFTAVVAGRSSSIVGHSMPSGDSSRLRRRPRRGRLTRIRRIPPGPLQEASDLESFYDHQVRVNSQATAKLRMRQLKSFLEGVRERVPFWTSPFERLDGRLHKKLLKVQRTDPDRSGLSKQELKELLAYCRTHDRKVHALVFVLVNTGMRSAELCNARWKDLEPRGDDYVLREVVVKGGRVQTKYLSRKCVEVLRRYRRKIDSEWLFPLGEGRPAGFTLIYNAAVATAPPVCPPTGFANWCIKESCRYWDAGAGCQHPEQRAAARNAERARRRKVPANTAQSSEAGVPIHHRSRERRAQRR